MDEIRFLPLVMVIFIFIFNLASALDIPQAPEFGSNATLTNQASAAATTSELVDLRAKVDGLKADFDDFQAALPASVSDGVIAGLTGYGNQQQEYINGLSVRIILGVTGGMMVALGIYAVVSYSFTTRVRQHERLIGDGSDQRRQ